MLELLVVIASTAVLLALLMAGIQKAREAALRAECANNLKQVILSTHLFADAYGGRLPTAGPEPGSPNSPDSLHFSLLPYIEHGDYYTLVKSGQIPNSSNQFIATFVCPADPDFDSPAGMTNYAANAWAFRNGPHLERSFPDGTSNTVGFAEHYCRCNKMQFNWFAYVPKQMVFPMGGFRRATFADFDPALGPYDPSQDDAYPVSAPGATESSLPGRTFQVAPLPADCDSRLAQTPHPNGMMVATCDGAVKSIFTGISEATFWSAMTPAGRDHLGADW